MARNEIKINIVGEAAKFIAAARGAETEAGKLGKTTKETSKSGALLGGAMVSAGAGLVTFAGKAVRAALDGEKSQAQLETAIRNTGGSVEKLGPQVDKVANSWSKYGYENDTANEALAKLITVSGSARKGMDLLQVTTDLAKARNMDLSRSADIVSKVVNGNVTSLSRYGIATKDSTGKTLTSAQALDALAKKYHGVSDEIANTPAGKIAAFRAQFANFEEEVGNRLLPVLTKFGTVTLDALDKVEGAWDSLPGPMKTVLELGGGIAVGAYGISKGYKFVTSTFKDVKSVVKDTIGLGKKLADRYLQTATETVAATTEADAGIASMGATATEAAAATTAASAEADASIATIGATATETAGVVTTATAEVDGALATIGATAQSQVATTEAAFTQIGGDADALAAQIQEAKAASSQGQWGGGGGPTGTAAPSDNSNSTPTVPLVLGAAMIGSALHTKQRVDRNRSDYYEGIVSSISVGQAEAGIDKGAAKGASDKEKLDAEGLSAALLKLKGIHYDVTEAAFAQTGAHKLGAAAGGLLAKAVADATKAEQDHTGATDRDTGANKKNAGSAKDQAAALDAYTKKLTGSFDPLFGVIDAQTQMRDSQLKVITATQAVAQAQKEHGRNSQEYRQALDDLSQAQEDQVKAALNQEGALATLSKGFKDGSIDADQMKSTLQKWVAQGKITQDQANGILFQLGVMKQKADELNGTNVTIGLGVRADPAVAKLFNLGQTRGGRGKAELRAGGGLIPGQGNEDSVPALLTPGEYVVRKSVVSKVGVDAMERLNRGHVQKFATGGFVAQPSLRQMAGWSPYEGGWRIAYGTGESKAIAKLLAAFGGVPQRDMHKRRIGFSETRSVEDVFYGRTWRESDRIISGLVDRGVAVFDRTAVDNGSIDPRLKGQAYFEAPGGRMVLIGSPGGPGVPMFHQGGDVQVRPGEGIARVRDGETVRTIDQELRVRQALGGQTVINVHEGAFQVTATPDVNAYEFGRRAMEGLMAYRRAGNVSTVRQLVS